MMTGAGMTDRPSVGLMSLHSARLCCSTEMPRMEQLVERHERSNMRRPDWFVPEHGA